MSDEVIHGRGDSLRDTVDAASKPTLTDAEREAVAELTDDPDYYGLTRTHTKVLRGLLERLR